MAARPTTLPGSHRGQVLGGKLQCVIHPPPMPSSLRPAPLPKSSVSSLKVGGSRPTVLVRGGCTLPKKEPVLGVEVRARVKEGKGLGAGERSGRQGCPALLPVQQDSGGLVLDSAHWKDTRRELGGRGLEGIQRQG